jgi:hypothetical protein
MGTGVEGYCQAQEAVLEELEGADDDWTDIDLEDI